MTDLESKCIQSWKDVLPEFEIKLWNEENFDFSAYAFSSGAYRFEKYAFVSDVCRLHALYQEGGIYLDTDMLVLREFDGFLDSDFFLGEEREELVNAAIIGSVKGNSLIFDLLSKYREINFQHDKPLDIPTFLTLNLDKSEVKIYPKEYFYPLPFSKRSQDYKTYIRPETYAVHLWNHSWKTEWSHLHDKSFGKALSGYFKRIQSSPKSIIGDTFPISFIKYFLADSFSDLYKKYKKG